MAIVQLYCLNFPKENNLLSFVEDGLNSPRKQKYELHTHTHARTYQVVNHDEEEGHVDMHGLALVVEGHDAPTVVGQHVSPQADHVVGGRSATCRAERERLMSTLQQLIVSTDNYKTDVCVTFVL